MVGNYDIDAPVEMAAWPNEGTEPDEQRMCKLSELYFEPATGDVVLTFEDRETGRFFDVSVTVKAVEKWNEFATNLPRVE
jgi:alpha-D-ribose 1-methylphosphonate 5-triphosphate synthase subunit PhnH